MTSRRSVDKPAPAPIGTPLARPARLIVPTATGVLAACALTACSIPTSRSNMVVVTENKVVVESCTSLGVVDGGLGFDQGLLLDRQRDALVARFKILAADAGGTHVLTPVASLRWTGPDSTGTIYKC